MKSIFFFLLLFSLNAHAIHGGGEVGNGGDLRRYYSEAMLEQAKQNFSALNDPQCDPIHTNAIYSDTQGSAQYQQIISRLFSLAFTLSSARIEWSTEDQNECVQFVKQGAYLVIRYSYLKCNWTLGGSGIYRYLDLGDSDSLYASYLAYAFQDLDAFIVKRFALQSNSLAGRCYRMNEAQSIGELNPGNQQSFPVDLEQARNLAIQAVLGMNLYSIETSETTAWFLQNRNALVTDLANTPYEFVRGNPFSVCATTDTVSKSPIRFGAADCKLLREWGGAVWLLLHETAHHLGVIDEAQADAFATEIVLKSSSGFKPSASF